MSNDWLGPEPAQILSTAKDLNQARLERRSLAQFPSPPPPDLVTAYRIQEAMISLTNREILGWRTQPISPGYRQALHSNRFAGPIFEGAITQVDESASAAVSVPLIANWHTTLTMELVFHLAAPAPAEEFDWNLESARALVGAVHWGLVISAGPYAGAANFGPTYIAADLGGIERVIVGPKVQDWERVDFAELTGQIDGSDYAPLAPEPDAPFDAMVFAAIHCAARARPLCAGQWICAGTEQPGQTINIGQQMNIGFGSDGQTLLQFEHPKA
jgi:2-keto-4-pentenoate hydratase